MITQVLRKESSFLFPLALPFIAIGSALGVWWFYLLQYTSNTPYWDDFLWAVNFMADWTQAKNAAQQWQHLFGFYFEHRIVWLRLFLLSSYWLNGTINFQTLLLIGNIGLLALPFLFWKSLPGRNLLVKISYLWPITWILWQPQCYHNIFTTYGLSNHYTILFVIGTIYTLIYFPHKLVLALLLAFLATFSTGTGLIVWGVGGSILVWQNRRNQLIIWTIVALICIVGYFGGGGKPSSFAPQNVPLLTKILNLPFYLPTFFFDIFDFGSLKAGKMTAMLIGILSFGGLLTWVFSQLKPILQASSWHQLPQVLWKARQNLSLNQLFLLHIVFFLGIVGLAAAFNRVGAKFNQWSFPDYYRIYSQIFIIVLYSWGLQYFSSRLQVRVIGMVFAGLFWMASYIIHTPHIINLHHQIEADAFNFKVNSRWSFYPAHRGPKEYHLINQNTHQIIESGIWQIPSFTSTFRQESISCEDCQVNISTDHTKPALKFQYTGYDSHSNTQFSAYQSSQHLWIAPLTQTIADLGYMLKHQSLTKPEPVSVVSINRYFFEATDIRPSSLRHWPLKAIPTPIDFGGDTELSVVHVQP
ncbi:hypothetical protein [Runella zeae]|uniref:hypothetical protein n=1 Tax=Runella zeae TaxID=94255 RepID=UPI0003FF3155|nr:hypothetical protein [Runella zeae]